MKLQWMGTFTVPFHLFLSSKSLVDIDFNFNKPAQDRMKIQHYEGMKSCGNSLPLTLSFFSFSYWLLCIACNTLNKPGPDSKTKTVELLCNIISKPPPSSESGKAQEWWIRLRSQHYLSCQSLRAARASLQLLRQLERLPKKRGWRGKRLVFPCFQMPKNLSSSGVSLMDIDSNIYTYLFGFLSYLEQTVRQSDEGVMVFTACLDGCCLFLQFVRASRSVEATGVASYTSELIKTSILPEVRKYLHWSWRFANCATEPDLFKH